MQGILRTLRTQWPGATGVVIGVTGVAFGATGQPAILGQSNKSGSPTVLQNTADGPAVSFVTKANQPPFTVTLGKQVPRLNASKLGGRPPGAFARSAKTYRKGPSDKRDAPRNGSTAYLSSSAPQLLLMRAPGGEVDLMGTQTTILSETVTPPANGTIIVRFTGTARPRRRPASSHSWWPTL